MFYRRSGFVLLDSLIGLMLKGRGEYRHYNISQQLLPANYTSAVAKINLKQFWSFEAIVTHKQPNSEEDHNAVERFQKGFYYINGWYKARWPCKSPTLTLRNDYKVALKRLKSTARKLRDNSELKAAYENVIAKQLDHGIIEVYIIIWPAYYMAYKLEVRKDHATTKMKNMFDACSKQCRNLLLNNLLLKRLVLLPLMIGILLRLCCSTTLI